MTRPRLTGTARADSEVWAVLVARPHEPMSLAPGEKLGTQANNNRSDQGSCDRTGRMAVGCPFCNVMLSDGFTEQESEKVPAQTSWSWT